MELDEKSLWIVKSFSELQLDSGSWVYFSPNCIALHNTACLVLFWFASKLHHTKRSWTILNWTELYCTAKLWLLNGFDLYWTVVTVTYRFVPSVHCVWTNPKYHTMKRHNLPIFWYDQLNKHWQPEGATCYLHWPGLQSGSRVQSG